MRLYVYCVAEGITFDAANLEGVAEQNVKVLDVEGLMVFASEFPGEAIALTRENVLKHEAVVRTVMARVTPLPFRFGTLVTLENLRSFIRSRKSALFDRLSLVRDSVEMSVKVIWQPRTVDPAPTKADVSLGVGAAFLLSKRQELLGDEKVLTEARGIADWLNSGVENLVRQSSENIQPSQKLVVSNAYLVKRSKEQEFRDAVNKLAAEKPELHFLVSGAWPPYTFANIDLEFETRFGVS